MKNILGAGVCLLLWPLVLSAAPVWFLSKSGTQRWGFIPAYSRNATYGHTFRGRFFIYPTEDVGYYTGLGVAVSEDLSVLTSAFYEYWMSNGDEWSLDASYNDFPDPYYGKMGHRTLPSHLKYIPTRRLRVQTQYLLELESFFYTGAFAAFSYRKELEQPIRYPEERLFFAGALLRYDSRSDRFNPFRGEFYEVRTWVQVPEGRPLFVRGDLRWFFPLFSRYLVLALHARTGWTFLKSGTYSTQFGLGGSDFLRGFWLRRFRGERFYLSQVELRVMPLSFLTLTGFFDAAAVSRRGESFFQPPRYSFGGGVLLGLPPKYNKKIRMEYGVGEDQKNFVVSFNHPF